jgi:aspartate aminotransferase
VPTLSERGRRFPASPIRKLAPLAEEAEKRGVRVLHLNIGQPDLETPEALRRRLHESRETVYAYTPSGGTKGFIETLRAYYARIGFQLSANELLATTGGSEALLFSLLATCNPGDEALVVEPFYTNYLAFAAMAGVNIVALTSRAEDAFHLPPDDAWEAVLTPRTKVVILCNPCNPTGVVYRRDEVERLAAFCKKHDLFLISDEVYRELAFDGRAATSALSIEGIADRAIVVDSLSKRYSACGIRLGCLATRNADVRDACLRLAQARLSPPGLAQLAALGAAELGPDYHAAVTAEYQRRRDVLFEALSAVPGVLLHKPEGAFYCIVGLPVDDAEAFARYLLEKFSEDGETVMVAPAGGFYATPGLGRNEVRLAYVLAEPELRKAVRLLAHAIDAYNAESQR